VFCCSRARFQWVLSSGPIPEAGNGSGHWGKSEDQVPADGHHQGVVSSEDALRTGLQTGLPAQRKGAGTTQTDPVSSKHPQTWNIEHKQNEDQIQKQGIEVDIFKYQ